MATTRALIYLIQRRHLLPCTVQMASRKSNFCFPIYTQQATYSDNKSVAKSGQKESESQVQVGFAEVVKENTKSAWYLTVIVAGIGVTAVMFYAIFKELFSSQSPNSIYSVTLDRCLNDTKVIDALGEPIKAYGEETRRGRRGHGSRKQGTVNLEITLEENGKWFYRYLFIQLKDISRSVIILEDNREIENTVYKTPEDTHELIPPGYKL